MANKKADDANARKLQAQYDAWRNAGGQTTREKQIVRAPTSTDTGNWNPLAGNDTWSDDNTGNDVYGGISAAESAARASAKAQSDKENSNTQAIINTLLGALGGFAKGRDTSVANADGVFNQAITGIGSQYGQSAADLDTQAGRNEADESAKTFANRSNRSRERQSLLEQAASQGAGETDQLRAVVQAFENADANQLEVQTSFADTLSSIRSSLTGMNSNTENARRNAWGQREDSRSQAWNDFYKNHSQTWTDIQRTAAQNTNTDSDYSNAFNANFNGHDPVAEAARYAGVQRKWEAPDDEFTSMWGGKRDTIGKESNTTQLSAMTRLGPVKKAEGSDLRKWNV